MVRADVSEGDIASHVGKQEDGKLTRSQTAGPWRVLELLGDSNVRFVSVVTEREANLSSSDCCLAVEGDENDEPQVK